LSHIRYNKTVLVFSLTAWGFAMSVHEKIRFIRQLKGWSQEETAQRLEMSANGYGSIERGDTDVNLSRLKQIANVFEVRLSDLVDPSEKTVFNQAGENNNQSNWHISSNQAESPLTILRLELEKMQLLLDQKDKEIAYLKEIIELLKQQATAPQV